MRLLNPIYQSSVKFFKVWYTAKNVSTFVVVVFVINGLMENSDEHNVNIK